MYLKKIKTSYYLGLVQAVFLTCSLLDNGTYSVMVAQTNQFMVRQGKEKRRWLSWSAGTANFIALFLLTLWPPNHMPKQSVDDPYDTVLTLLWSHEQWCLQGIWSLLCMPLKAFHLFLVSILNSPWKSPSLWSGFRLLGPDWLIDKICLPKLGVHQNFVCNLVYYQHIIFDMLNLC